MNAKRLLTIVVASMLLIGGVAALGAAAPADAANDDADTRAADDAGPDRSGDAASVGPSGGLPQQVPDHVRSIHDTIDAFLGGEVSNLGESLSGLLGGGEAADDAADGNADA